MDNKVLQDNFRKQLTNTHALTVLTVSLIEIIGYIIFIQLGIEEWSLQNSYFRYKVLLPIFINVVTHLCARVFLNVKKLNRRQKNSVIIVAALITSFVVAVFHKEYIATGCAFVFPMVLSAIFNDKKLLNTSLFASIVILLCVAGVIVYENNMDLTSGLNLVVLLGFAIVSYFCGIISIRFSDESYTTIKAQAEENDKLLDNVQRDQMTGLYNHNAFFKYLDVAIERGKGGVDVCLVMIDVDDFKIVNDTYGHDCGDRVLVRLSKIIKRNTTKHDVCCRYGGEEFAIIFKHKSIDDGHKIMQKILEDFRNHKFDFSESAITFSAGIAKYEVGLTRNDLFALADKTMYLAKGTGKNCIQKSIKETVKRTAE